MKAYVYTDRIALDALLPEDRADPVLGPHDIALRMRALSLNYRDLAIACGQYHAAMMPPLIPISDGAGEVIAIGTNVTRFRPGDLVCPIYLPDWIDGPPTPEKLRRRLGGPNDGVMAELVRVHEEAAIHAPSHLDPFEAASLPVAAVTAWHCLFELGHVRPGEVVVTIGTGGVSLAALQFAHAAGARPIAITRREEHAAHLRSLGAHAVIVDCSDTWPPRVMELTNGIGADVVLDVVGSASVGRSIEATRHGGLVHLVGYAAGKEARFDIFEAIRHAVTIRTATAGSRQDFEKLVCVMEQHKIFPPIDRTFPISKFRDAFDYLQHGGHFGKVALTF